MAALRPFDGLEVGDDLRLHEVSGARRRRAGPKRALVCSQRLQLLVELVQRPVREAGASLPGVDELAVLVVPAQQRAGVALALALSVEPAPDDELLPVVVFDLD